MGKNSIVRVSRDSSETFLELKTRYTVNHTLDLEPEVSRNRIWKWNSCEKSKFVESILLALPTPLIYFSEDKFGKLKIFDGRQRLKTIFDFTEDKFELTSCPILQDLNGKKFTDIDSSDKSRLEDYYVTIAIVKPQTPYYVKVELFDRLNSDNLFKVRNKENAVF